MSEKTHYLAETIEHIDITRIDAVPLHARRFRHTRRAVSGFERFASDDRS